MFTFIDKESKHWGVELRKARALINAATEEFNKAFDRAARMGFPKSERMEMAEFLSAESGKVIKRLDFPIDSFQLSRIADQFVQAACRVKAWSRNPDLHPEPEKKFKDLAYAISLNVLTIRENLPE